MRTRRTLVVTGAKNSQPWSQSVASAANGRRVSGRHCGGQSRLVVSFAVCVVGKRVVASGVLCWIFYLFISGYLVFYTRQQRECTPQDNVSVIVLLCSPEGIAKTPVNKLSMSLIATNELTSSQSSQVRSIVRHLEWPSEISFNTPLSINRVWNFTRTSWCPYVILCGRFVEWPRMNLVQQARVSSFIRNPIVNALANLNLATDHPFSDYLL